MSRDTVLSIPVLWLVRVLCGGAVILLEGCKVHVKSDWPKRRTTDELAQPRVFESANRNGFFWNRTDISGASCQGHSDTPRLSDATGDAIGAAACGLVPVGAGRWFRLLWQTAHGVCCRLALA